MVIKLAHTSYFQLERGVRAMFFVVNLKKIRLPLITVLLFVVLTAIIAQRVKLESEAAEVVNRLTERRVLIIDAGHGGLDGGASSSDGMLESTINLAVARKLEFLSHLFGVKSVMTRTTDELDYPDSAKTVREKKNWDQKTRAELISSIPNAVLISIHQNTYPDPRPHGSQVLYGKVHGSQELGELTHNLLIEILNPENRRVAEPISDKIYLMRKAQCPAILVECGFLSNAQESALLADDEYQTKLAMVLLASYLILFPY